MITRSKWWWTRCYVCLSVNISYHHKWRLIRRTGCHCTAAACTARNRGKTINHSASSSSQLPSAKADGFQTGKTTHLANVFVVLSSIQTLRRQTRRAVTRWKWQHHHRWGLVFTTWSTILWNWNHTTGLWTGCRARKCSEELRTEAAWCGRLSYRWVINCNYMSEELTESQQMKNKQEAKEIKWEIKNQGIKK